MTDPNCIFCKIAAGDIPCTKVFESVDALAFMDIGPLAEGHVLLIPKQHYATIDEMPAEGAALLMGHIPALVRAVQAVTGCEGVNVLQNNGKAAIRRCRTCMCTSSRGPRATRSASPGQRGATPRAGRGNWRRRSLGSYDKSPQHA